ncbi:hypothetical protein N7465_007629 [Penicillium sp. CMV-2018d]|nr:hypothetical protein N7465_007629 [Penicillium sp. CMV-2018d]
MLATSSLPTQPSSSKHSSRYDGVSQCQQHAPWKLGAVPSASAVLGEAAFLKSASGPQGSQHTIPKAILTPVPPRQEVTLPASLSRNKLHAHLRDTGHSNQQPPESLRALTATIVSEDDSADKHYNPLIESERTTRPISPSKPTRHGDTLSRPWDPSKQTCDLHRFRLSDDSHRRLFSS